jgi:hypothetical protein
MIQSVHDRCNTVLASKIPPVTKLVQIHDIINSSNLEQNKDLVELLTNIANQLRSIIRQSAWQGSEPITFKEAVAEYLELDDNEWQELEEVLDHERDYNWNYLNILEFNYNFNRKSNLEFFLSFQHYRLLAIIKATTDIQTAKVLYKKSDQIPKIILPVLKKISKTLK